MIPLDALEWHEIERYLTPHIVRKLKRLLRLADALMGPPTDDERDEIYAEGASITVIQNLLCRRQDEWRRSRGPK